VRASRGLLIVLAVAVVIAVAVAIWFGLRRGPSAEPPGTIPPPPETVLLEFSDLPVRSADLAVGPATVRGAIQDGFTSWLVVIPCSEPGGCAGELAVELDYHTGSAPGSLVLAGRYDVPSGGELRFEGLQEPSTPVDQIDRVTLEVRFDGDADGLIDGVID
jgi:hypothetical protein